MLAHVQSAALRCAVPAGLLMWQPSVGLVSGDCRMSQDTSG